MEAQKLIDIQFQQAARLRNQLLQSNLILIACRSTMAAVRAGTKQPAEMEELEKCIDHELDRQFDASMESLRKSEELLRSTKSIPWGETTETTGKTITHTIATTRHDP